MARSTIGTDPEFFLTKGDKLVSAIGIIPGTKENPHTLPSGSGLQTDNVALEFSSRVAKDGNELVVSLSETFKEIMKYIPEGHTIQAIPSARFSEDQLDNEEAQRFGCSPDFNAWTLEVNPVPCHEDPTFRSCGGHIHVGHVEGDGNEFLKDPYGKVEMVKIMDTLHGIISTVLDSSPQANERRKLYGKAGCHRPTDYGLEYRVLSNFWMKSPQLVMLMDSLTQDALRLIREHKAGDIIEQIGEETIQNIIDEGRVEEATHIIEKYLLSEMSEDSIYYFNECSNKVSTYELQKEWALEA